MILLALMLAGADTTAATATPTPPAAEKVKCKYQPVIGTIAQTVKECHTAAEWDVMRRATQDDARRIMNSAVSSRSN